MDSLAVQLWRNKFKLNLSARWKRDVDVTVKNLNLWEEIIEGWFYFDKQGKKHSKHPGIKGLLDDYERLVELKNAIQRKDVPIHNRESFPQRTQGRVPKSEMPALLERQSGWQG